MRRRIFLLSLASGLLLAGCGSSPASTTSASSTTSPNGTAPSSAALPAALQGFQPATAGVLTVATNLPGPGFWDGNSPSTMTGGFEYGMAQYMAAALHLRLNVVNVAWDGLVAGEVKGFDLALSTINITPARQQVALFSIPYFNSDQGILVRAGTSVTNANARNLRWGVEQSSTSYTYLTTMLKPVQQPRVYQDQPSMFAALAAHQIDAVLLDTVEVLAEAKQSSGALQVVGQYKTGGVYGALLPQGSPNLAIVNTLIRQMQANGTLRKLDQEYLVPEFGGDPATVPYLQP
jgi:polar amino acid transport system substrate-binding protein